MRLLRTLAPYQIIRYDLGVQTVFERTGEMNISEFSALKVGDKVENVFSHSTGEVVETTDSGVRVRWGAIPGAMPFFYSVVSTSWFHWSKPE